MGGGGADGVHAGKMLLGTIVPFVNRGVFLGVLIIHRRIRVD